MALFGKIIVIGLGEVGSAWFKVASKLNASIIGIDINKNKERKGKNSNAYLPSFY